MSRCVGDHQWIAKMATEGKGVGVMLLSLVETPAVALYLTEADKRGNEMLFQSIRARDLGSLLIRAVRVIQALFAPSSNCTCNQVCRVFRHGVSRCAICRRSVQILSGKSSFNAVSHRLDDTPRQRLPRSPVAASDLPPVRFRFRKYQPS